MIVGIDLGTSTSELAYFRNGKAELLREVAGTSSGILPSVVGLTSKGKLDVGDAMVGQREHRPTMVVEEVKRKMGTDATVKIGDDEYRPQEVSAMILRRLKESAERFFGHPILEAIITVPANFNDNQRRATLEAGELAGLKVRRLINEPTAAALAYGIDRPGVEERVLVYDLGGGTLDVTVLELSEGVIDVLSSVGIPQLGGKDFDTRLMTHLAKECRRSTGVDLTDAQGRTKLNAAARRAKVALSTQDSCDVLIEHIGLGPDGPITFEYHLTRAEFDSLILDLVNSSCDAIHEALEVKGLVPEDIDTILMVGGSTRVPLVRSVVSAVFGGRPLKTDVNPDEAVSLGAAILGGIEAGTVSSEQTVITDVAPHTFGLAVVIEEDEEEIHDVFSPIIKKHSTIPRTERRSYHTMIDFQEHVKIRVFQGEEPSCDDNLFICEFLHPMAPAPAGAEVMVEFSYDLSSNLHLAAVDVATGERTEFHWNLASGFNSAEAKEAAAARINSRWSEPASGGDGKAGGSPNSAPAAPASGREWERSPLWPSVSALHAHAVKRVATLGAAEQSRVRALLNTLETCALRGDGVGLEAAEDNLTQLLFDLE